jgi:hypothetical protein
VPLWFPKVPTFLPSAEAEAIIPLGPEIFQPLPLPLPLLRAAQPLCFPLWTFGLL